VFQSRPGSREFDDVAMMNAGLLQDKLNEVSSTLTTMLQVQTTHLSRSVSSVGEHASNTFTAVPIPKRAETFAGFDNNHEHKSKSNKCGKSHELKKMMMKFFKDTGIKHIESFAIIRKS